MTSQPKTYNSMDEVMTSVINQLPKSMKDRVRTQTNSSTIAVQVQNPDESGTGRFVTVNLEYLEIVDTASNDQFAYVVLNSSMGNADRQTLRAGEQQQVLENAPIIFDFHWQKRKEARGSRK